MGSIKLSTVHGNSQWLDGGSMFGHVPRPVWSKWFTPDNMGRVKLACRCLLIETEEGKILCETGVGAFFEPKLRQRFGVTPESHNLLQSLKDIGLDDSDIDLVVLSHLHFDHAGGLLPQWSPLEEPEASGSHELLFPNASFLVGRDAYERARNPHLRDRASFIADLPEKLERSGRLLLQEGSEPQHPLLQGRARFLYSEGHTPGQMHLLFRGQERSIFFAGDWIPGVSWVHLPVTMGYDRCSETLVNEKQNLYENTLADDDLVFFHHDPETAFCCIRKKENKYLAEPCLGDQVRMPI